MNCCLWIILLLACRGNCGFGCGNNWSGSGRNRYGMNDCDYDNDMSCDRSDYYDDRSDDCGCDRNDNCMSCDTYDCNDNRMSYDTYDRNDNRMSYETYGCQENGVPCPPPVPGNYAR